MTESANNFPPSDDPLNLNWELRQALASTHLRVGAWDAETLSRDTSAAAYRLAEVLGECRLCGVHVAADIDGSLPPGLALAAMSHAAIEIGGIHSLRQKLAAFRDELRRNVALLLAERAVTIEHEEYAISAMERRWSLAAVTESFMEAYLAGIEGPHDSVRRFRAAFQHHLNGLAALDQEMTQSIELFLPFRRTRLLSNWRQMLSEPYSDMSMRWWFLDEDLWRQAERLSGVERPSYQQALTGTVVDAPAVSLIASYSRRDVPVDLDNDGNIHISRQLRKDWSVAVRVFCGAGYMPLKSVSLAGLAGVCALPNGQGLWHIPLDSLDMHARLSALQQPLHIELADGRRITVED